MAIHKSLKEIVKETNVEFLRAFKSYSPIVSIIILLIVLVGLVIFAFSINTLLGYFSLAASFFGGYWMIKFINNLYYYWRP